MDGILKPKSFPEYRYKPPDRFLPLFRLGPKSGGFPLWSEEMDQKPGASKNRIDSALRQDMIMEEPHGGRANLRSTQELVSTL